MSDNSKPLMNVCDCCKGITSNSYVHKIDRIPAVCAHDADVTFRSNDRVLFQIHRKYLETNTGGLSSEGFMTFDEVIPLPEDSSTLELLFQFIYPMRYPTVMLMLFDTLLILAEAAEKYEVFAAMNICSMHMQ
jgi:hypothetical protein